jgi:succinoglycan biosynthesis protein ExoA
MSCCNSPRPLVSVILSVYNEAAHIEQVIYSILCQSRPTFDLEILVIDGKSTDGTYELIKKIAESSPALRLLVNEQRRIPFAWNIGLKQARGEYVCIFGAHTVYDPDYISTCLSELKRHDAIGCGGRVFTTAANASLQARLVATCVGNPFGTSSKSFRNHPEGYADTINYPVYLRTAVMTIGGYDEQLYRNEDNDLNQRLRAHGHQLYMTWKTSCRYFVQPTIPLMLEYAWNQGYWNVIGLKKNASAHAVYHFVPAMFVLAWLLSSVSAVASFYLPASSRVWTTLPFSVVVGTYFAAAFTVSTLLLVNQRWQPAMLLPLVFFSFHVSYGLGTLWAILCNAQSPEGRRACNTPQQVRQTRGVQ